MPVEPEDRQALHPGGFIAIVLATLQLAAATTTAYVCGLLSMAYMAWVVPGVVGLLVTGALFVGAVTASVTTFATKRRGRWVAALGIVLALLAFGGLYGGCRKGLHDLECTNALPGTPKCAGFW